ncbi:MAG: hypothetical protein WC759_01235 [Candidatus Micrarchaeia archaeon]
MPLAQRSELVFITSQLSAQIVLDDFSISDSSFTQGETVSFSVTFENIANTETTATAHVYIFNSLGAEVDSFDYSSTQVAPNQQKVQIKSWDSNTLPAGTYVAKSNVTFLPFNGSTSVSNELNLTFTIRGGGGGGGGGGGPEEVSPFKPSLPIVPIITPAEIRARAGGPVDFVKFPVLKEVVAGQSGIQGMAFVNRRAAEQEVVIDVQGMSPDWISVSDKETKVLPGETRNMDIALSIPADAPVGDYLVRVDAKAAKNAADFSSDFMVVRVKNPGTERPTPIVLRTVEVDRVSAKTTVSLSLRNPTQKNIDRILLDDTLPSELGAYNVQFRDKPGGITQVDGKKVLSWEVPELLSNEEMKLGYSLSGVLGEYSPYVNKYDYQIEIAKRTDLASLVKILDMQATAIDSKGGAQVVSTVLYVGEDPLPVTMTLEAPTSFTVEPTYLSVTLLPRNTFTARFQLKAPENAAQDSQLVRFLLYTDDGQVSARLPLVLEKGSEPGTSAAIAVKPGDAAMAGMLLLALILGYALYQRRGGGGGAQFDKERLEYAKSVMKTVKLK